MFFDQSGTNLLLKAVPSLLSLEESAALKSSRGSDYLGSVMVESVIAYFAGKYYEESPRIGMSHSRPDGQIRPDADLAERLFARSEQLQSRLYQALGKGAEFAAASLRSEGKHGVSRHSSTPARRSRSAGERVLQGPASAQPVVSEPLVDIAMRGMVGRRNAWRLSTEERETPVVGPRNPESRASHPVQDSLSG